MDLPIFIGNTYCLFVAKVLDLSVTLAKLKYYVIIYTTNQTTRVLFNSSSILVRG